MRAQRKHVVEIIGIHRCSRKAVVTGIEMFRKLLDTAQVGDNVGLLLRGIQENGIQRGQCLVEPYSTGTHQKFIAQVNVLEKDEGGRHTPFFNHYQPQFWNSIFDLRFVTVVELLEADSQYIMTPNWFDS